MMNFVTIIVALGASYAVSGQDAPSLGLEYGGSLSDDAFSASSFAGDNTPARSRLNTKGEAAAWVPDPTDSDSWIQVDLGVEHELWNIATQGRNDGRASYTISYEVELSSDGTNFVSAGTRFTGNKSKNKVKKRPLNKQRARYVRVKPVQCQKNNGCALRFDLFGYKACSDSKFNFQLRESCYQYILSPANFTTQSRICEQDGGHLASISNSDENAFVADIAMSGGGAERAWVGGQRSEEDGEFVWAGNADFVYTNWRQGKNQVEPNNWAGKENCIEINFVRKGLWNDHFCERSKPAVCKKPV